MLRELPPKGEVDGVVEPKVAESPRDGVSPKRGKRRRRCSRRSKSRCKAKGMVKTPSHEDERNATSALVEKAEGNNSYVDGHTKRSRKTSYKGDARRSKDCSRGVRQVKKMRREHCENE